MRRLVAALVAGAALVAPAAAAAIHPHGHPFGPSVVFDNAPAMSEFEAILLTAQLHNDIHDPVLRFGETARLSSNAWRVTVRTQRFYHLHRCTADWEHIGAWRANFTGCKLNW